MHRYILKRGFKVTEICCDNEFHSAMDIYLRKKDPHIHMKYAAAQEHVPHAEHNDRTTQERVKATYH